MYELVAGRLLRRTHPAIVELAALRAGERVLDVGCGPGSLTIAMRASVGPTGSLQGIDASREMIEAARRNASRTGAGVEFQVGLAEALPFPGGTFDVVVSQLAAHHWPDDLKPTAFGEMHRVLKPGGRCLIVDFEPPRSFLGRLAGRLLIGSGMMRINVTDYRALLEQAGFTRVESGRTRHGLLSFIGGRKESTAPGDGGGTAR